MWCHLPTGFKRRTTLRFVAIIPVFIALFTTLIFPFDSSAAPGINKTLNFQGRLLRSTGGVVPDGHYNIEFKIYEGGAGDTAGNPGGELAWTETYINNGASGGVQVKNGLMSVNLGSKTPFGTSIDWNNDTLWLSMNVAGSAVDCTAFNAGTCVADGEMTPMKRLTSTPYALNAGMVGGVAAEDLVQIAQGVQTDESNNTSSIAINKTGTGGDYLQLQRAGSDVMRVDQGGNIVFGNSTNHAISVGASADNTAGRELAIRAGNGGNGSGSTGGTLMLQGGNAGGTNADGGSVAIEGGLANGSGSAGSIYIGSSNNAGVQIGNTNLSSGEQTIVIGVNSNSGGVSNVIIGSTENSGGGSTTVQAKDNVTLATNGVDRATFDDNGNLTLGNGNSSNTPADFNIQGTASTASGVKGGSLSIQGGDATTGNTDGGDLTLNGGTGSGTGNNGNVNIGTENTDNVNIGSTDNTSTNIDGGSVNVTTDTNFTVNNSDGNAPLFSVNTGNQTEYATNGGAETAGGSSTTFPGTGWGAASATVTRQDTAGPYVASGSGAVKVVADTAFTGAYNTLTGALTPNTTYNLSATVKLESGTFNDLGVFYAPDGSTPSVVCSNSGISVSTSQWTKVSCSFTTPASGIVSGNSVAFGQLTSSGAHTYYLDNLSVTQADNTAANVQVGGGNKGGATTLLTLDSASSAPIASDNSALLGSMYYDTSLGKIQCYEADGWGSCGASPDNIISMTPEYSSAVMHGTGVGAMTASFCSDDLDINTDICGNNQTFNYYQWTSPQTTNQTYSIYVTYKLPSTFQAFAAGSTALHGLTDSSDSAVSYEVFRSDASGLTACGSTVSVSTGDPGNWQTGTAGGSADPSACGFSAGDSLVVKVNVVSKNNANAYVGNLDFTFSNQ